MKSILITLLAVVSLGITATAQEKRIRKPGEQMMHQRGMMAKELNLTADQKKQAKQYREEFRKNMTELNKNENMTVKDFRDRKAALLKEQKTRMQSLLTPEQKAKMAQLKNDQKAKRDEHFAKHLDKMKTELGLTDQQMASLKTQRELQRTKIMAIKENESLSREQKRDQLETLRAEAKEQHKKIFTETQLRKMEELKKTRGEKPPLNNK